MKVISPTPNLVEQVKDALINEIASGQLKPGERIIPKREKADIDPADLPRRSAEVESDNTVFVPPFLGTKVVKGIGLDDIAGRWRIDRRFEPSMDAETRDRLLAKWSKAVARSFDWTD